ncbi:MAG: serine O-acetyltransferase [Polyangiaceae bacterium]
MANAAVASNQEWEEQGRAVPPLIDQIAATLVALHRESENPILGLSEAEIPSIIDVRDLIEDLREALFPGLAGGQRLLRADAIGVLATRLHHLQVRLGRAIEVARRLRRAALGADPVRANDGGASPNAEALAFLAQLPKVRQSLVDDAWAALEGDPAATSLEEIVLTYPGHFAVSVYRLAHELWHLKVPYLPRMMTELAHRQTGIDIHPAANIGQRFFIDHGTGVVIGETAVIGDRVRLYQGVTLGAHSPGRHVNLQWSRSEKRHPTLESDVIVYAGATILGGDTVVGRGAIVGGSSWIVSSVPAGAEVTVNSQVTVSTGEANPGG